MERDLIITDLETSLTNARNMYYNEGCSPMSDAEFDSAEALLKRIDPTNAFFGRVGAEVSSDRPKVQHSSRLLSIQKFYTVDEVEAWAASYKDVVTSVKMDGLALCLRYVDGDLVQAITRGDGFEGQDVTDNAFYLDIPKKLKHKITIEVRGEACMSHAELSRLNAIQIELDDDVFANCRNTAASSMTAVNPEKGPKNRKLDFIAYDLLGQGSDYIASLGSLTEYGFTTVRWTTNFVGSMSSSDWIQKESLDYDSDGLVFRVNSYDAYLAAGNNQQSYKAHACLKPARTLETTVISNISWEVSRHSVITPVSEVVPVSIEGALIGRINIGSVQMLEKLNIAVGDTVLVTRAGMIIPQIVANISKRIVNTNLVDSGDINLDAYTSDSVMTEVVIPSICPVCGSNTRLDESRVRLHCTREPECLGSTARRLDYFCKTLGIKHLGVGIAEKFLKKYPAFEYSEIIDLGSYPVIGIQGNLVRVIRDIERVVTDLRSGKIPVWEILHGLGPVMVGSTRLNQIFNKLRGSSTRLEDLTESWYKSNLPACGDRFAEILKAGLDISVIQTYYNICKRWELNPYLKEEVVSEKKSGGVFCVTGTLSMTRNEFVEVMESKGYTFKDSVTKGLDFLVIGENCGSKLAKAQKMGLKIIKEVDALGM